MDPALAGATEAEAEAAAELAAAETRAEEVMDRERAEDMLCAEAEAVALGGEKKKIHKGVGRVQQMKEHVEGSRSLRGSIEDRRTLPKK